MAHASRLSGRPTLQRFLAPGASLLLISSVVSDPVQASDLKHLKEVGDVRCFSISGNSQTVVTGEGKAAVVGEKSSYLTDANNGIPYWSNREFQRPQMPQMNGNKNMTIVRYR